MPTEIMALALQAYIETLKFLTMIIQDQPKELREQSWRNWFAFFTPMWKAFGLDVANAPPPPKA